MKLLVSFLFCSFVLAMNVPGQKMPESLFGNSEDTTLKINSQKTIDSVIWSLQADNCTVYTVFPASSKRSSPIGRPKIEVWLLENEGKAISPKEVPHFSSVGSVGTTDSVVFIFPFEARHKAVALVLSVDSEFFVCPLPIYKKA